MAQIDKNWNLNFRDGSNVQDGGITPLNSNLLNAISWQLQGITKLLCGETVNFSQGTPFVTDNETKVIRFNTPAATSDLQTTAWKYYTDTSGNSETISTKFTQVISSISTSINNAIAALNVANIGTEDSLLVQLTQANGIISVLKSVKISELELSSTQISGLDTILTNLTTWTDNFGLQFTPVEYIDKSVITNIEQDTTYKNKINVTRSTLTKEYINGLSDELSGLNTHKNSTDIHITADERTKWTNHADSDHAPADAEKNENAFSIINVSGQSSVEADTTTDTLTLVAGDNVTITTDADNDTVTIAAEKYEHPTYTGKTTGLYKITVDTTGHVSAATAVTKDDITNLGIPAQDTTYTLPDAGLSLGGVKTGGDVTISEGVITVNDDSHNHIISNINDLQNVLDGKAPAEHSHSYIPTSDKGASNGVATLGSDGKVPTSQLPAYVDDVLEYNNSTSFPQEGETEKIYVAKDTNVTYRWSGSQYVEISASLALGTTSSTAFPGDQGNTAYNHSQITSGNPHGVTKSDIGLENVENKSSETIRSELTNANVTTALGYIPLTNATTLADLSQNANCRTVTDEEKTTWNSKSDFSGNYSDLSGIPDTFAPTEHGHSVKDINELENYTLFEEDIFVHKECGGLEVGDNLNGMSIIEILTTLLDLRLECPHTFSEEWSSDETNHWHAATCEHTDEISDLGTHEYVDGVCVCGKEAPHEHTYSDAWTTNETHHWHVATCEHSDQTSDPLEHTYDADSDTCSVCGYTRTTNTEGSDDDTPVTEEPNGEES